MLLAREDAFGPVVAVYRTTDDDEAVALANDSYFGLNASVWSARRGEAVARRLLTGTVNVNEGYAATWASHDAPIVGMKESGAGRRHGREGILKYTEPQTIAVQRLLRVAPLPGMSNRTYARIMKGATRVMGRRLALGAARRGSRVVIWDVDVQRGTAVRDEIRAAGGLAEAHAVDVKDRGGVKAAAAVARHGSVLGLLWTEAARSRRTNGRRNSLRQLDEVRRS